MRPRDDDAELTHEQRTLRDNVAQFLAREVAPTVSHYEEKGEFDWTLPRRLAPFGMLGGFLPEERGGYGLSHLEYALLMEEAGYCWHSLRSTLNTMNMAVLLLDALGTPAQKQRYLESLLAGELRVWVGITEPNHGSNVAGLETRAYRDGDEYVINGSKMWITNGAIAELGILLARVVPHPAGAPSASGAEGITAFLVEKDKTAYTTRRLPTMILRSTVTTEMAFVDARVPATNVLGEVGGGLRAMLRGLNFGRLSVATGAVGAAQAALDLTVEYARTRRQFGHPLASFQLVQKMVVDMKVRTDAARQLCRRAARALDRGLPARMECSIAKLYAAQAAHEVADLALQVHGGLGYSREYPIERIFRDTRGAVIPEGTSEIQTLIIGRDLLGVSAFAPGHS
jgi:alkylation response protein AidB-like acyl-CoA dehydrogenase